MDSPELDSGAKPMTKCHLRLIALLLCSFTPFSLLADEPTKPPVLKGEIVVTPERGAAERDAVAAS